MKVSRAFEIQLPEEELQARKQKQQVINILWVALMILFSFSGLMTEFFTRDLTPRGAQWTSVIICLVLASGFAILALADLRVDPHVRPAFPDTDHALPLYQDASYPGLGHLVIFADEIRRRQLVASASGFPVVTPELRLHKSDILSVQRKVLAGDWIGYAIRYATITKPQSVWLFPRDLKAFEQALDPHGALRASGRWEEAA